MPGGSPGAHELLCSEGEVSAKTDRRVRNYGRLTKQLSLLRCHCFMIVTAVFLSLRLLGCWRLMSVHRWLGEMYGSSGRIFRNWVSIEVTLEL